MKLHIKCFHHMVDENGVMELMVNMEDLFRMLDGVKPRNIADYLCTRMREAEPYGSRLVESVVTWDVEGIPEVDFTIEEGGGHGTL